MESWFELGVGIGALELEYQAVEAEFDSSLGILQCPQLKRFY